MLGAPTEADAITAKLVANFLRQLAGCDYVYRNEDGEQRLVVSVNGSGTKSVVVWRTSDPSLPKGVKSQGSATAASFGRWAVGVRVATSEDWRAFEEVEQRRKWRRSDSVAIRRIKQRLQRDRAAKEGT